MYKLDLAMKVQRNAQLARYRSVLLYDVKRATSRSSSRCKASPVQIDESEPEGSLDNYLKTGADMYLQSSFNGQVIGPLGCGIFPIGSL